MATLEQLDYEKGRRAEGRVWPPEQLPDRLFHADSEQVGEEQRTDGQQGQLDCTVDQQGQVVRHIG